MLRIIYFTSRTVLPWHSQSLLTYVYFNVRGYLCVLVCLYWNLHTNYICVCVHECTCMHLYVLFPPLPTLITPPSPAPSARTKKYRRIRKYPEMVRGIIKGKCLIKMSGPPCYARIACVLHLPRIMEARADFSSHLVI